MMRKDLLPVLRKSILVWLGWSAGISIIAACGGGSAGGASPGPGPANAPVATITSPTGNDFKEGENITFSGTATDAEDGQLTGGALVWTSSIDGPIGTGETLITSALSAGDHDITLTATDSTGANAIATLPTIQIAKTRFIKMGALATDVADASNAFDEDSDTAATIATPDTEFIYFKAYLGKADAFFCKIKTGASTPGSTLVLQGLSTGDTWQPISDYELDSDKTVIVRIDNAQNYIDAQDYINLRICWEGGDSGDTAPVYEIWRIDPVFAGSQTTGVDNPDLAFDGDALTPATILQPWDSSGGSIFYYKAYVGTGIADKFAFKIQINSIDQFQSLFFDTENLTTSTWETKGSLTINTTEARTVSIPITSDNLDPDGYVTLRARWVNGSLSPPASSVYVYEIQRVDYFYIDSRTSFVLIQDPEYAVDQNRDTYAIMHNYWGENNHYDTLNIVAYLGDIPNFRFSIKTAQSLTYYESELIVEGEGDQDDWPEIKRILLNQTTPATDIIELHNARQYINADGWLSLRVRWEDHSQAPEPPANGYIYEIWPGVD